MLSSVRFGSVCRHVSARGSDDIIRVLYTTRTYRSTGMDKGTCGEDMATDDLDLCVWRRRARSGSESANRLISANLDLGVGRLGDSSNSGTVRARVWVLRAAL